MFITFEGLDGSGKTTILSKLITLIKDRFPNIDFLVTREPGGKDLKEAERIREIILDSSSDLSPVAEAMLYSTSRRIHLEKVIWPALKNKRLVFCDRYIDSFYAYQGFARELGYKFVKDLTNLIIDNAIPDLTIFLDITPEKSKERRSKTRLVEDRLELENIDFHKKVYLGYKQIINEDPKRFIVVDASGTLEDVTNEIFNLLIKNEKFINYLKKGN
ncbi:dTMP kinase [Mycoplasma sp. CSL10137]|uniref:dTMP kinase n=1 Tax=unclassified Mycoplasma TaxID=2683645 RepID=UPI00197B96EB|nr:MULTISPECIES: dTMP kinase [unclassified Mycoplasma]MBN4083709.1 dTMP kinase [Mycoplasma sp. CSL10137]MBU4693137.1 dTMP kinase [Mycoplasma sp. CSL7491-lung]